MMTEGNSTITIIQGDSYDRTITIEGIDTELIKEVYISCSELNLCKQLIKSPDGSFTFSLSSEETKGFKEFYGNYDLTVKFNNNKIKTLLYKSFIKILAKTNGITCV